MTAGRQERDDVIAVTSARPPHSDDLDARMRRYLISMLIRTICVVLVVVIDSPVRWVFAVGAVFLPYVAVVMANAGGTRRPAGPTAVPRVETQAPPIAATRPAITANTVMEGHVLRTGDISGPPDS